jgi:hypothetical protein
MVEATECLHIPLIKQLHIPLIKQLRTGSNYQACLRIHHLSTLCLALAYTC